METGGGEERNRVCDGRRWKVNKNRGPVSVALLIRSLYGATVYLTAQRRCKSWVTRLLADRCVTHARTDARTHGRTHAHVVVALKLLLVYFVNLACQGRVHVDFGLIHSSRKS